MPGTVTFDFDPNATFYGAVFRWETLGVAAAILVALLVAAIRAGRTPAAAGKPGHLRRDDLLLIALGAIPGAVVGGRLGYVLLHIDYFRTRPEAIFDPGSGSMSLTLAVVLGTAAGLAVARLLGAPLDRWLHVAAVPMLLILGLGKLATALGGSGQGTFGDSALATRYVRNAAWGSAFPDRAATASQLIEGGLVLLAAAAILVVPVLLRLRARRQGPIVRPGRAPRRDWRLLRGARRYLVALLLWSLARFVAASTWRDAKVLGDLRAEQLLLGGLILGCLLALGVGESAALAGVRQLRPGRAQKRPGDPEPETRPAR